MTGLLTILVLLGITIAIWQMVKIFDLAQVNKDVSQVANDKDNRVNGYLMLAFLGFIYGITIVSFALWGDLPLTSNSASEHGPEIDRLMIISMVVIFIVQTNALQIAFKKPCKRNEVRRPGQKHFVKLHLFFCK